MKQRILFSKPLIIKYITSIPKEQIFEIIFRIPKKHKRETLCCIAKVSLSGYYKHRKLLIEKNTKEAREKEEIELLRKLCKTRRKGYRRITMELKRKGKDINHKKVLRLMKKYNLLATVRKRNPYKSILKATQEHKICKNILQRNF